MEIINFSILYYYVYIVPFKIHEKRPEAVASSDRPGVTMHPAQPDK